ncbi:MAG: DUF4252 domain-containing protein [bacterium]|nr:DUF4252 domain-containing protein [bacterium]
MSRRMLRAAALCALLTLPAGVALAKSAGCVDGQPFVELAGDDDVLVEVSIHGALLKAIVNSHADLKALVGGLESIHAVIIDVSDDADASEKARNKMRAIESRLMKGEWQRLARIRDGDAEVKVLVLSEEETVHGLVVMVLEIDGGEMVFANVCGAVDLAALQKLGSTFDIPGFEHLPEP